jgi:hypothetical protein
LTQHGRQKVLTITSTHAKTEKIAKTLTVISRFFKSLQETAEQLTSAMILKRIIETAYVKFFRSWNKSPPNALPAPA